MRPAPRTPGKMEKFLQIAPHSLAIVLGPAESPAGGEKPRASRPPVPARTHPPQLGRHHIGYEIFADFKAENMQHFWNKKVTAAVAETFFLGWIDEQVLLIQGKEEHLEALREGWTRRALRPPSGFHIRCLGECRRRVPALPGHPGSAGRAHGSPRGRRAWGGKRRTGRSSARARGTRGHSRPGPAEPPGGAGGAPRGAVPGAGQVGGAAAAREPAVCRPRVALFPRRACPAEEGEEGGFGKPRSALSAIRMRLGPPLPPPFPWVATLGRVPKLRC